MRIERKKKSVKITETDKWGMKCPKCKYQDESMIICQIGWYRCKNCGNVFYWG